MRKRRKITDAEKEHEEEIFENFLEALDNSKPKESEETKETKGMKIKDNVQNGVCRVYHSTKAKNLPDIIMNDEFNSGSGFGSMLGNGFYCNLQLHQAQKGNYGPNIMMAEVYDLSTFLILEYSVFTHWYGTLSDVDEDNYIEYQAKLFGAEHLTHTVQKKKTYNYHKYYGRRDTPEVKIPLLSKEAKSMFESTARYGQFLNNKQIRTKCKTKPSGLIYHGGYDGLSMVCWYPRIYIVPIAMSVDKGKTFQDIPNQEFKDFKQDTTKKAAVKFSRREENIRSDQRAVDLKEKYRGRTSDDQLKAINSHLSRIKNKSKWEKRKESLMHEFSDIKDLIEPIEFKG